jgi:hypothetical protein
MILAVEAKQPDLKAPEAKPAARLNPLQTEVIELFVELSRLLGHPCKIYNVLSVAAPVLYIGPQPSHVSEILNAIGNQALCAVAAHGEVDQVVRQIQRFRKESAATSAHAPTGAGSLFSKEALLPKLIAVLESA